MKTGLLSTSGGRTRALLCSWPFLVAVQTVAAIVLAANRLSDSDIWLHLATGRTILEQGLPGKNLWSYTWPDYPWEIPHWGFSVLLRGIELASGAIGIELLQIVLVCLTFLVVADTARRKQPTGPAALFFFLTLVGLLASRFRFVPRPDLATNLCLALLANLWERKSPCLPLWLSLTAAVWANLHPGVAYGAITLAVLCSAEVLERHPGSLRRAAVSAGAFFAGSLLNPYVFGPYRYAFSHLSIADRNVLPIIDFLPADSNEFASFYFLALLGLLALWPRLRQKHYGYALNLTLWFLAAAKMRRLIPAFVVIALPDIFAGLTPVWSRMTGCGSRRATRLVLCCAAMIAVLVLTASTFKASAEIELGLGIDERRVPEGACRFVEEQALRGNLYNDYGDGAYIAWRFYPKRKVFMDGRALAYPAAFFREVLENSDPVSWQRIVQKYDFSYAIVRRYAQYGQEDWGTLFNRLGWPMVYLDGSSAVFIKPTSQDAARLRQLRFQLIGYDVDASVLAYRAGLSSTQMLRELRRVRPSSLVAPYDFYRFGAAAYNAGDPRLAFSFFSEGLRLTHGNERLSEEFRRFFPPAPTRG